MKPGISGQRGFTIMEVMIELAVAGLILLIVFRAVPALNRNARNYSRKNAVNFVAGELNTYYSSNGARYPLSGTAPTDDKRTNFVTYIKSKGPASGYDIRYTNENGPHEYPFNTYDPSWTFDEISIEPGHRCNTSPTANLGDADYPLMTAHGGDQDFRAYVVWTQLEQARVYCVDNAFGN